MERLTEHTFRRGEGQVSPQAMLEQMAWLVGHWSGPAFGGVCEEVWSAPAGGAMMGMFRLVQGEATVFYEFLTLTQEQGTLSLQLKHFQPDLTGWEDKQDRVTFALVAMEPEAAHFEGMSFHRTDEDHITIYLAIRQKDGSYQETTFAYARLHARACVI
jgi:hypothetical protein